MIRESFPELPQKSTIEYTLFINKRVSITNFLCAY